jgi:hypothetical protein
LHLPQLHEKLNLVSIELKFIVGLYCNWRSPNSRDTKFNFMPSLKTIHC